MFCSFKVELKSPAESFPTEGAPASKPAKFRSEWEHVVESASSQWVRDHPRTPIARNVGGTRKKKWSPLEDQILRAAVGRFGLNNWRSVAMFVPGRSSKQCRERWLGHMAPDNTKDEWSVQEDMILVERQALMGNQWAQIKGFLPGRSVVSVKNRWNWLCRRDVQNHTQEFGEIARAQAKSEDAVSCPGAPFAPEPGHEGQSDSWAENWAMELFF
jgi:hypothetical protein